jgi:hypothetical protein
MIMLQYPSAKCHMQNEQLEVQYTEKNSITKRTVKS